MAQPITDNLEQALKKNQITPLIVVKFDDWPILYGNASIYKYIKIGDPDLLIGDDWVIGGFRLLENQSSYILFNTGTTTRISQKVDPAKGQSASVQQMIISMQDKNDEISELVSLNGAFADILGKGVTIYQGEQDTAFPEDFNAIIRGVVQAVESTQGVVNLIIANADEKKRASILPNISTKLTADISDVAVSAPVDSTDEFYEPADSGVFRTYLAADSELIEYTSKDPTNFLGLARAQGVSGFQSVAAAHEDEATLEQIIRLKDNGINLALKLMLSQGPTFYLDQALAQSFVYYDPSTSVPNAVFFDNIFLQADHGVTVGDLVTITGATNGGNNVTDSEIIEVGLTNSGSYIVLADTLILETSTNAVVSFKSKYNVLPIGFGMKPNEVDVDQHVFIRDTFLPSFELDLYVKEITDGKGFLEKEVYLPMTVFSVPRKGRSSCVYTVAPLATYEIVAIDSTTVDEDSIKTLKVGRSTSENFYNQVRSSYDYNPITDKFLSNMINPTEVDQSERPVGVKPFIQAFKGLRTSSDASNLSVRAAERLLRRYQKGAEFIKNIKINFRVGYQIEIGDIVSVDFASLKLTDYNKGSRDGDVKLMEVLNKVIDNKTGEIIIDVVNTAFGVGDRYGLISPSSLSDVGSTPTKIILKRSFTNAGTVIPESKKWNGYVGQKILIHDENWTQEYETVIRAFDNNTPVGMNIDSIGVSIGENWIIQPIEYPDDVDPRVESFWKNRHAFASPTVVPNATSLNQDEFIVSGADLGRFFVGSIVRVHNYSYSVDSGDVTVTEITGNTIKVNESLGFLADTSHFVDLIGFPDQTQAYRVI